MCLVVTRGPGVVGIPDGVDQMSLQMHHMISLPCTIVWPLSLESPGSCDLLAGSLVAALLQEDNQPLETVPVVKT